MEQILLIVKGNFPTPKAYGVTTSQTIKCLKDYGHKVICVAFRPFNEISYHGDDANVLYFEENGLLPYIRKFSYRGFGKPAQVSWKVVCHFAFLSLPKTITRLKPTIVWVRDSIPGSLLNKSTTNVTYVIELHDLIKKGTITQLSSLSKERVILAPISLSIQRDLERYQLPFKVILSPMGVDLTQFEISGTEHLIPEQRIRIGYFGKLAPGGYSKGYDDLIDLAAFHQSINFPSIIQLVGATDSEIKKLKGYVQKRNIKPERFELESHKPHQETILLMQKCDVLTLTTPSSSTYHGSPIKAIEYAATGKPILAAKSGVNEDVFSGNVMPYWYESGNVESMHDAFISILNDPDREKKNEKMREFAGNRTWILRTGKILDLVVDNRKEGI